MRRFFPELRCSLAKFVEGNDIARMSFKKKPLKKKESSDAEPDIVKIKFKGSNGDLTKEWNEKFNVDGTKMVSNVNQFLFICRERERT